MSSETDQNKVFINITDQRSPAMWKSRLYSALVPIVLIGTGAVLESTAMQWVGFLFVLLMALDVVAKSNSERLTISQARARLDELDRGQT